MKRIEPGNFSSECHALSSSSAPVHKETNCRDDDRDRHCELDYIR